MRETGRNMTRGRKVVIYNNITLDTVFSTFYFSHTAFTEGSRGFIPIL